LGRDVLSRIIFGSRTTLSVGVLVVLIGGTFGILVGLIAGYRGGRTDAFLMRAVDTQFAFPGLLLALTIITMLGASLWSVVLVLSLGAWMVFARVARGSTLSVKEAGYIEAAETVGCRPRRVIFRHILPNLLSPLSTLAILEFAAVVLAEASLSFLGLGIQPPASSWGLDVATGRQYIFTAWWLVTFPGIAIALTVLATNLVASPARRPPRACRGLNIDVIVIRTSSGASRVTDAWRSGRSISSSRGGRPADSFLLTTWAGPGGEGCLVPHRSDRDSRSGGGVGLG
jgi:peptide/nickel transport system permease protein